MTITRYAPAGECIYCGTRDGLSEEHIVPFALGGTHVLPEASCKTHRDVTSGFEGRVCRGFMLPTRTVAGFPTRRPGERPSGFAAKLSRDDGTTWEDTRFPVDEFPALLPLLRFERAAYLSGAKIGPGVRTNGYNLLRFGKDPKESTILQGATTFQDTVDVDATSFARLIAKIGWGFAVALMPGLTRAKCPVLPFIVGDADDGSHWIGSGEFRLAIEERRPTHAVGIAETLSADGMTTLIAQVKLFADTGATGYEVVVQRDWLAGV